MKDLLLAFFSDYLEWERFMLFLSINGLFLPYVSKR